MREQVEVPVRLVNKEKWGDLNVLGSTHFFVGERCDVVKQKYNFAGNHRVRLYKIRKNVHWRIPKTLDISGVEAPRREMR